MIEPFDVLDISSEASSFGTRLRHPVYRSLTTEFALVVGFEQRGSQSFLLGEAFDFIGRGDDGKSRVNALSLSQQVTYRNTHQVLAVQSQFEFGLDTHNATEGDEPDGVFNAWSGQLQWARRTGWRDSLVSWRTLLQLTDDPMLSSEQFAIGGHGTVRGYRENQLTHDNGLVTSLEWRIGIADSGRLQMMPFIDYGRGWSAEGDGPPPRDISSVGVGWLWSASHHLSAELYLAKALRTVETGLENDLQEEGIHFQLSMRW
ncbi:hypothetical protein AB835_03795 [Candidatus Endobugula sertula]|uniref:Haemolysin activator HlyB C-terminal domain-containing protein n=1 Tax=Candidatus Endobugula sertula TaxID=62101 RepID=A0A1D2QS60_9GAMM|nr:hypothetical protein AB835_03795 [Candidatus Endobugula sertula]